jgi:hypothetical protein
MSAEEREELAYTLVTRIRGLKEEYIDTETAIDRVIDIVNEELETSY